MIQDPVKRSRVKRTLLIIIFVTIPCYLLGGIVLLVNEGIRGRATITPTTAPLFTEPPTSTPSNPPTITATETVTPSETATDTIPTEEPTEEPSP